MPPSIGTRVGCAIAVVSAALCSAGSLHAETYPGKLVVMVTALIAHHQP